MARPTIVPEIVALLEPWLEAQMERWDAQPETGRVPTLPSTEEGKVNVRAVTLALGLKRTQEQHFYNHAELRTLVNVAAEAQGLSAIGSRVQSDADDSAVRKRIARIAGDRNDLSTVLAEREALIEVQRREIEALREQLEIRSETGLTIRDKWEQ